MLILAWYSRRARRMTMDRFIVILAAVSSLVLGCNAISGIGDYETADQQAATFVFDGGDGGRDVELVESESGVDVAPDTGRASDSLDAEEAVDAGGLDSGVEVDVCVMRPHQLAMSIWRSVIPKDYSSCLPTGVDDATYSEALLAEQVERTVVASPSYYVWDLVAKIVYCDGVDGAWSPSPGLGKEPCLTRKVIMSLTSTIYMTWCRSGVVRGRAGYAGGIDCPTSDKPVTWR